MYRKQNREITTKTDLIIKISLKAYKGIETKNIKYDTKL